MQNSFESECILCGNKNHIKLKNKYAENFEICTSCGIIRNKNLQNNIKNFQINQKFFISKVKIFRAINQAKLLLENILKYAEPPKSFLEISAKNGVLSYIANKQNFNVIAIDENPNNANFIKENFNFLVFNQDIISSNFSQKFDVISLSNSFCDYNNPLKILTKINEIIKEGGIFLVGFRDVEKPKISPSRFFNNEISYYFNDENFKWLLFKAGFEIIDDFSEDFSNFRYFICKRVRKPNLAVTIPLKENFEKIYSTTSEYNKNMYYKSKLPYSKMYEKIKNYPKQYFSTIKGKNLANFIDKFI